MAYLLVPVATVRTALRIDPGESDVWIELLTSAASRAVAAYIKGQFADVVIPGPDSPPQDSPANSPPDDLMTVDERIQLGVIRTVQAYYDSRDPESFGYLGELPRDVMNILYPLRDPALA